MTILVLSEVKILKNIKLKGAETNLGKRQVKSCKYKMLNVKYKMC